MRKLLVLLTVLVLSGCGASDECFHSTGSVTIKEIPVDATNPFTKITVFTGIALVVKQGDYAIKVQSGANIIDDISVKVENGLLTLKDETGCNLVRSYGQTKVFVTAPNIEEIYSNTEKDITSDGVLTFPILRLFSMSEFFGGTGTGDFHIQVDNGQLVIETNHVAGFYISGQTDQMLLNFYDGIGRFEGENLLATSIIVFQRGSNDVIVHPVESLTGDIYGVGNVISKTHPPTVNVLEHWSGRLIYQ